MDFTQLARQNPWWTDPAAIVRDRHLRRLADMPLRWTPPLPFRFDRDAIYTLRGPRQVGKSTVLKRLVERLIGEKWPTRRILYLDVELAGIDHQRDLIDALRTYLDAVRPPTGEEARCVILLDEVTRVPSWSGALRALVDNGELDGVTLIASGSHAADLREGGERMPGRRGGGAELDVFLFPLAFREYVQLVRPDLRLPAPTVDLHPAAVAGTLVERASVGHILAGLFRDYLTTGGFLTAINDMRNHNAVRPETFDLYRQAIVGEFTRAGLRESSLREVVAWLTTHLGQEFNPGDIAKDTDIGSKDTARRYLDHLVDTYVVEIVYRTQHHDKPEPAFRAPRKIHPLDPLHYHALRGWAVGEPDPWQLAQRVLEDPGPRGHFVESLVLVHLRRAFGARVFYWRPDRGKEIDAVVFGADRLPFYAEVKYRSQFDARELDELLAVAGGGLVLGIEKSQWRADGRIYELPVPEFLACLDAPALTTRLGSAGPASERST